MKKKTKTKEDLSSKKATKKFKKKSSKKPKNPLPT